VPSIFFGSPSLCDVPMVFVVVVGTLFGLQGLSRGQQLGATVSLICPARRRKRSRARRKKNMMNSGYCTCSPCLSSRLRPPDSPHLPRSCVEDKIQTAYGFLFIFYVPSIVWRAGRPMRIHNINFCLSGGCFANCGGLWRPTARRRSRQR